MLRAAACLVASLVCAVPTLRAQASSGPAPTRAIPPGTYDLAITFGGGVIPGSLTIGWVRDSLTAGLMVGGHESPVKPGTVRGNNLVLDAASPAMQIRYELAFRGDSVTGTFVYDGQSGVVAGRRMPAKK